jgi:protein-disulfide isomerase
MLLNQKRQETYAKLINDLKAQAQIKIMLDPWRVPVADNGRPSRGLKTAPVTIIEFSDYACPFCGRAEETVKQVRQAYGDLVRVVFRNYPLPFHENAQKAAEAAGCSEEQGKFWEMHEKLFSNSESLSVENIKTYAKELGLEIARFEQCLNSGKRAVEVAKDFQDGKSAGVSGTPAFFINGRFLSGAQPFKNFAVIIDDELIRAGAKIPPKPLETAAQ